MVWNIWSKKDILWIKWLHTYYMKQADVKDFKPSHNFSWIIKAIFKNKDMMTNSEACQKFQTDGRCKTSIMYSYSRRDKPKVDLRVMFYGNIARPRAIFIHWMTCQNRPMTKGKVIKYGISTDGLCTFCNMLESCHHLFFECVYTKQV
ncbi:unnamed protein product [Lathyrus sativus]|nr:unnamed protein product [Lathyrus sativus]